MKKFRVKKIFIVLKAIAGLAVLAAAGWAVYLSSLNVKVPAELLEPVVSPKQRHYPVGYLSTPILMYHHIRVPAPGDWYSVSPAIFAAQMRWLKDNGYTPISYAQFYNALTTTSTLPANAVVITFDDGYRDQYQNAYPVLKQYGWPAIFFVYTRDLGRKKGFMTYEMLSEMSADGFEIGSHTYSHRRLDKLNDSDLAFELGQSKQDLESHLQRKVDFFAYPYGLFSEAVVRGVEQAGYLSAVTVRVKPGNDKKDGPYFVTRVKVNNDVGSLAYRMKNNH